MSDKIGYSYTYSVSTVVDADGDPIVYEAPSNNVVQVDTRDVEKDIIINITTISNSVYNYTNNNTAILTVEYTDLNGADLDLARDDAIPQYVEAMGSNYRFMLDLTGLTKTEVAYWNETVYINDVLMYGNLPKSGTVNLTAPNTGMVQGITSLEDKGLRVNAGDTVEIIISDIVLDNEVVVPEPQTNTLTLDGAAWKGAKVYSVDGKTDYPTTEETEFGQVVALTAEIPADVEEVVVVINGKQINVSMPGDVTLTEDDLGLETGTKVTVTVAGKDYVVDKNADGGKVTGVPEGKYIAAKTADAEYVKTVGADGVLTLDDLSSDRELYAAYEVVLPDGVTATLSDGKTAVKDYVAEGEEILLDKGTYMVNGEMVTIGDGEPLPVNGKINVEKVITESNDLADAIEAGGTVYLAEGEFRLSAGTVVSDDLTIIGTGNTVLYASNAAPGAGMFDITSASDITLKISGVIFDCSSAYGVVTRPAATSSVEIENCTFNNVKNMAIYLENVDGGYIRNCTFNMERDSNCAIGLDSVKDFVISGNTYNGTAGTIKGYDIEMFSTHFPCEVDVQDEAAVAP